MPRIAVFSTTGIAQLACAQLALRIRSRRCGRHWRADSKSRSSCHRVVLIELRASWRGARASVAEQPGGSAGTGRALARQMVAMLEQSTSRHAETTRRRRAPGILRAWPRRPAGRRPCPGDWRRETRACPRPRAPRAGSRGNHGGCRRRRRDRESPRRTPRPDRTSASRSTAACRRDSPARRCSRHRAD